MAKRIAKSKSKIRIPEIVEVVGSGNPLVTGRGGAVAEAQPRQPQATDTLESLRGSVLHYERPFDPVGEDEWEALSEP